MDGSHRRAVVLLSGGLDSTTAAAIARSEGFELYALTFDYGQRHRIEIDCAQRVAEAAGVENTVLPIDPFSALGGDALTDESVAVDQVTQAVDAYMKITDAYLGAVTPEHELSSPSSPTP